MLHWSPASMRENRRQVQPAHTTAPLFSRHTLRPGTEGQSGQKPKKTSHEHLDPGAFRAVDDFTRRRPSRAFAMFQIARSLWLDARGSAWQPPARQRTRRGQRARAICRRPASRPRSRQNRDLLHRLALRPARQQHEASRRCAFAGMPGVDDLSPPPSKRRTSRR